MKNPFLIGQKIYLRPLERSDAAVLQPWFNDPDVTCFTLRYRPISLQEEEQYIEHISKQEQNIVLLIVCREDDRIMGVTSLHQINYKNRNATFGITIGDKSCWGMGFGTEATELILQYSFQILNLHRVTLHVFEYNPRAIHIYEKLGFKKEGILREETFWDGKYHDTIVMGLLREEWNNMKE